MNNSTCPGTPLWSDSEVASDPLSHELVFWKLIQGVWNYDLWNPFFVQSFPSLSWCVGIQTHIHNNSLIVLASSYLVKKQSHCFANKGSYSQSYSFSSSHIWKWELDHKEDWEPKYWCFWSVVLEMTLESSLDCKETKPVNPKGNQSWIFIGRTDAEPEAPVLWPSYVKRHLIWKDCDARKDWRWEEKGTTEDEMVGWHHRLDGHEFEQSDGVGRGSLACWSPWGHKELDTTEQLNSNKLLPLRRRLCDMLRLSVVSDPRDCSPQAPPSTGILQARILEWVAMPSSRGSSQSRGCTQVSHNAGRFFTI